ncbi:ribonuclease Z [Virgibacillus pantothenticus]|uniref:ribonuclease Z n=1 Tax=Virgibacillus pantothenticus TaxID=1473 RepID=UPI001C221980|nr:ribonuclease Z [Virgibacillus pantothenticus]MBU8565457.1 ribonuclease Z [Virgibacillus pantothenticus]MBU8599757.1 ribonuclease Z [Virgibacillus pantothenticus]MBU8634204.1 ribonuclease Z [Virgibacillus pantothenticus]MBU8641498.1 ribonuclease Z [Virgibacillus pantothenticus]MBU8646049.1 ribonuclease Z [Virgibacillus pantothenticus]
MELIFLGTGAGVPSKERNVSAIALSLLQEQNSIWLFDCGEATQHQILHTSLKPRKINKIFITHMHGDHIYGLPGFLSSRSFQGGDTPLTIYGPKGLKQYVETSLALSETHLAYAISFVEVTDQMVIEAGQFQVFVQLLEHGIPCFGYRVVEKDKPGELLVNKLKDRGIEPGPIYQEIKENDHVTIPHIGTIYRKDVLGEPKRGKIISLIGDTRFSKDHIRLAQNADILIHEATFGKDKQNLAHRYFHSTTLEAAQLASESNCKHLILTHISSRYQQETNEQLLQEAREIFPNTELANDFSRFTIT